MANTATQPKCEPPVQAWDRSWRSTRQRPRRPNFFNVLIARWLREAVPDFGSLSYIELGGGGELLAMLAPSVRAVAGLDISEEALARCRRRLAAAANASTVRADLFDYAPAQPFDVAMSFGVIEHFHGSRLLDSVRAHARCAGRYVVIGTPADVPHNWWRAVRHLHTGEFPAWRPMDAPALWTLFEQAGIRPMAATRLDPSYACAGTWWRAYRAAVRLGLFNQRALHHPRGGLALMLGRVADRHETGQE